MQWRPEVQLEGYVTLGLNPPRRGRKGGCPVAKAFLFCAAQNMIELRSARLLRGRWGGGVWLHPAEAGCT